MKDVWDCFVQNAQGDRFSLREKLPSKCSVVVFLRQGECIECSIMIHELQKLYGPLKAWDVPLIFVANGTFDTMARLRNRLALSESVSLFTDPSLEIYQKLGLHAGYGRSFGPRGMWTIIKGFYDGFSQTRLGTNLPQQSGVVVLDPQHTVLWIHRSEYLGDIPAAGSILEQVLRYQTNRTSPSTI